MKDPELKGKTNGNQKEDQTEGKTNTRFTHPWSGMVIFGIEVPIMDHVLSMNYL